MIDNKDEIFAQLEEAALEIIAKKRTQMLLLSDKVAFDDFLGAEKHTLVKFYAPVSKAVRLSRTLLHRFLRGT